MVSSGIFLSTFCIINILLLLRFTTPFITKSSGLSISFSSTYAAIISTNFLPYLRAFPLLTPWHFSSSSTVVGYIVAISSRLVSKNITKGGSFFSLATCFLKSLSVSNNFSSVALLEAATGAASSSSALASSNKLFSTTLNETGFFKKAPPFLVSFSTPYSSISFLMNPSKIICLNKEFQKCSSWPFPIPKKSRSSCRNIFTCGFGLPLNMCMIYSIVNCSSSPLITCKAFCASFLASICSLGLLQLSHILVH